jgi:hypothetical protein
MVPEQPHRIGSDNSVSFERIALLRGTHNVHGIVPIVLSFSCLGDGALLVFAINHQQRNNKVPEEIALI